MLILGVSNDHSRYQRNENNNSREYSDSINKVDCQSHDQNFYTAGLLPRSKKLEKLLCGC